MAPKKKTAKKNPEKSENDLDATYKRSILDIAVLQDHIALQCESIIKVQSDKNDLRRRMRDMEQKLQQERQDHRDINSDLSRQYKTMQTELTNKVKRLEEDVSQLKEELAMCQEELRKGKRDRDQMEQEKDATIADLQHKLDNMEIDYERVLHAGQRKAGCQVEPGGIRRCMLHVLSKLCTVREPDSSVRARVPGRGEGDKADAS
uniref:Dynein regulatory complex protein 12 n=1 Tax=Monopterus albus TaxID=43700 RepID=A0A3Q3IT47_MONAL|nr:coiled-coil domain-containing protein 153-like isoform X1 [Monopterus albus]